MGPAAEASPAGNLTARFPIAARRYPKRGDEPLLEREYQALEALRGPGAVRVLRFCRMQKASVLWLERAAFGSLLALAGRPRRQWLPFAQQAADYLARIHRSGWVHGDVKAEHVRFRAADEVCWIDFGSARPIGARRAPVTPGVADPGARGLAFPDQDVYAFGLLLLQLESGHFPTKAHRVLDHHSVWGRCLVAEPKRRPTMDAVAAELQRLAEGERAHD